MKIALAVIAAIIGFIVLAFGIQWMVMGGDFWFYKFFAPRQEAVRREVFEQSKAYRQGMTQELDGFYRDYAKATPSEKEALRSIVLHRVADFPTSGLPEHLRSWVNDLRNPTPSNKETYK